MRPLSYVILLLITFPVFAERSEHNEEIVVTARRIEEPLTNTVPHTTVITQEEIRQSQAIDVLTILKQEAGFEFVQSGGVGSQSSVLLRGTNSNQTLVLLDGVRINSATTGATALDQIMLDQIERIEIVRGNVSSIYGSEAIGGVIQIFLKQNHGAPKLNAGISYGGDDTKRYTFNYGGEINDSRFNIGIADFKTDGFSALRSNASPTADPDRDGYRNLNFSANFVQRINESNQLGFHYFITRGDLDFDDAFALSMNDKQTADTEISALSGFWQSQIGKNWTSKLTVSQGSDKLDSFVNGVLDSSFKTTNSLASWQNDFRLSHLGNVNLGLESLRQDVVSTTAFTSTLREVNGLWGGYANNFGAHHVQINGREEHYSDFGRAGTYFLGYGYDISSKWRFNISNSTAFRAPTFNDLFFPFGFGNPDLQPERARSSEVNFQYKYGSHLGRVAIFHTRISDLIGGFPITNINKAVIDGMEFSYSGKLLGADVKASVTLQDPIDETTNQQLIRRATKFASFTIRKSWGPWNVGGEIHASDKRFDNQITTFPAQRVELAGYGIVNVTARYDINKHFSLSLRGTNIFDKDYTLADGFNTQGRLFLLTLSWQQ